MTNVAEIEESSRVDLDSTPGNNAPGEDDRDTATVSVNGSGDPPSADLSLDKTVADPTAGVCGRTTFTITVSNDGPSDATGVTVLDDTPAGVRVVDVDAGQGTYDTDTGEWNVGILPDGSSATLELTVEVTGSEGITQVDVAQVFAADQNDPDSTPGNDAPGEDDQDSATIDVTGGTGGFVSGRVSDQDNDDVAAAIVVVTDATTGFASPRR